MIQLFNCVLLPSLLLKSVVFVLHRNTSAHQLILQKNEQIYKLLAIAVAMCPSTTRCLEENVRDQLHFKCNTELYEMQGSNIDSFKKAFGQGCPKFVTAAPPDLSETGADNHLVGYHGALQLFVSEVCINFCYFYPSYISGYSVSSCLSFRPSVRQTQCEAICHRFDTALWYISVVVHSLFCFLLSQRFCHSSGSVVGSRSILEI